MKVRTTIVLAFAASCSRSEAAPVERRVVAANEEPISVASHDDDPIAVLARTNRACEACHPVHAQEWRASRHRNAFTDEAFATAYERTPFRFCRDCHAPHAKDLLDDARPDAKPNPRLDGWVADNGVACVTCHVPADDPAAVLSGIGATAPGTSHHVLRPASFADERACAGCHEFRFPDADASGADADPMVVAATLMQRTLWEHERSPFADASCASCHMPEVGDGADRHRDHRFASSDERLRAALVVTASRPRPDRVVLELEPVGVGHAFPTGDLFRRLELKIETLDSTGRTTAVQRRYLERHFAPRRRGEPYRRVQPLERDDRLAGPATFAFDLPGTSPADIRWSVTYQRVDHRVADAPERSTLHGQTVLAHGRL